MPIYKLKELSFKQTAPDSFIFLSPSCSLFEAAKALLEHEVHRLPLIDSTNDSQSVIAVLTQFKILRFIAMNCAATHPFLECSLQELQLGTFENIDSIRPSTPLSEALNLILSKNISAIPVVDEDDKVLDVYEKYDVFALSQFLGPYFDLNMSVQEALSHRSADFRGIQTCSRKDSLGQILDTFKHTRVHRFIILKEDRVTLDGILTLEDILRFCISPIKPTTPPTPKLQKKAL
jgi:CBS domain-containing protein